MIGQSWVMWVAEGYELANHSLLLPTLGDSMSAKGWEGEQYRNAWQTKTTDANHQWHIIGLKMKDKPFSMAYKDLRHLALSTFPASSLRPLTVPWRHRAACHSWRRPCFLLYLQTSAGDALPASLPKPCFVHVRCFKRKPFPRLRLPETPCFRRSSPAALEVSA